MTLKTHTLAKFPEITAEDILNAKQGFENLTGMTHRMKCSPEAYIAIKDYFVKEEQEEMFRKMLIKETDKVHKFKQHYNPEPPLNYWGQLYGVDIVLDPDLKPGEWRFE